MATSLQENGSNYPVVAPRRPPDAYVDFTSSDSESEDESTDYEGTSPGNSAVQVKHALFDDVNRQVVVFGR